MYQSNAMETRREHQSGPPEGPENAPLRAARRDEKGRPDRRLRVVRAPGGFAFVEDEPDTRSRVGGGEVRP